MEKRSTVTSSLFLTLYLQLQTILLHLLPVNILIPLNLYSYHFFGILLLLLTHLKHIKLQAEALNPTYIKAFPDTVILYYTTTTPLFRSTPSLLLRYVLPHDNKDPSSSGENYVPEFSVMFWGAFLFQSLLWQRCAEVHVE